MDIDKKITVRCIKAEDLPLILKWRTDPDITKYMKTDPDLDMNIQKKWFQDIKKDCGVRYWMIEVDYQPAGVINLVNIDLCNGSGDWGYYIGEKSLRSFSVAVALECSLYDYVFDRLGLKKIHNEVLSINPGVIKLHEYCGNRVTEIVKRGVMKHDEQYDLVMMELTCDEWMNRRSEFSYYKINFTEED